MPAMRLEDINQTQKERLFHIDFKVCFLGTIGRNDLVSRFGIKEAAATRDITLYKELAPKNLEYDTKAKIYARTNAFEPLFDYSPAKPWQRLHTDSVMTSLARTRVSLRAKYRRS